MNVPLIKMPRSVARQKFLEYKRALDRRRGTAGDEQVMAGYRALSQGQTLLEINQVMRAAGLDAQWRPKLAIARADARHCFFEHRVAGGVFTMEYRSGCRVNKRVELARGTFNVPWEVRHQFRDCRAIVPTIPPHLRPRKDVLRQYLILWEAEWETVPVDPILLKPVGGSIYAVVAQWDLTELEQAVLAGTL